ncbi:hypothetical protein [Acidovorax sp. CF316]|uniref:hypothetical protein n=1 Tax=Acidovorax sp. CF316 TaxID=1144317 RepID=UPI0011B2503D|nr:hypothetical protein [Acidovorax sp. CF316]
MRQLLAQGLQVCKRWLDQLDLQPASAFGKNCLALKLAERAPTDPAHVPVRQLNLDEIDAGGELGAWRRDRSNVHEVMKKRGTRGH